LAIGGDIKEDLVGVEKEGLVICERQVVSSQMGDAILPWG
jgi:hypothetical protein